MAAIRDASGKFIKGKPGGPGRPPRATEAEYLDALKESLPLDRFKKIVDAYAKRAERGDTRAAEVLFKHVLPQVSRVEHSGTDGDVIKILVEYVDGGKNTSAE